jgi:hypothetical protein
LLRDDFFLLRLFALCGMTFGFAMFFLQIGTSLRSYEVGTSLRSYEVGTRGQNLALLLPAGLPRITI